MSATIVAMFMPVWALLAVANIRLNKQIVDEKRGFLARAREVVPARVARDYDSSLVPWQFWRWSRAIDGDHVSDAIMLRHATQLRRLRRRSWLHVAMMMTAVATYIALMLKG